MEPPIYGGNETLFFINLFYFVRKVATVSEGLSAVESSIQIVGAATENACLLIFSLILGTIIDLLH